MHVTFASAALQLEGELVMPASPVGAAVVCHPHPQYGGNMFNPVVRTMAEALVASGFAALRFNFRGVGASEGAFAGGIGEADDAAAAARWLIGRCGATRLIIAGYSFGALVALRTAANLPEVTAVVAVAPPIPVAPSDDVRQGAHPVLYIAGSDDPYCPAGELMRHAAAQAAACRIIADADHFLYGDEPEIAAAIRNFLPPPSQPHRPPDP